MPVLPAHLIDSIAEVATQPTGRQGEHKSESTWVTLCAHVRVGCQDVSGRHKSKRRMR